MKFDLSLARQHRGFDIGIFLVDRRGARIYGRFAHHCDLQDARGNRRRRHQGAQPIHALLLPHLVELVWRSRQQHDNPWLSIHDVCSHCPGAVPASSAAPSRPAGCRLAAHCSPASGCGVRQIVCTAAVTIAWSRFSEIPSAAATLSRVRSSCVGPRPPMKMAMSARPIAVRATAVRWSPVVPDHGFEGDTDAQFIQASR